MNTAPVNETSPYFGIAINALVAIIAVTVTYIAGKRNRWNSGVTQFRQEWINDLRQAISLFIAKAEVISMLDLDDDEYYEHYQELSESNNMVELLLNPNEDQHNELISKMDEIRELIHDETYNDPDKFEKKVDKKVMELLEISKAVLKTEWNVVKRGK